MSNLDGKAQKPEPLTGVHLEGESLQERYSPQSICFGCGPANAQGLHVRSFPQGVKMDELPAPGESPAAPVVARFIPQSHHQAFPGMLNGGIIGALLDCHSNWTAAWTLMRAQGQVKEAPCTVTADFHVKLLRPTPANTEIQIEAIATEMKSDRARIEARLFANGKLCATCTGTFVQVKEGHPAYHRW